MTTIWLCYSGVLITGMAICNLMCIRAMRREIDSLLSTVSELANYSSDLLERIQACSKDVSDAIERVESVELDGDGLNREVANLVCKYSDLENRLDQLESKDEEVDE